MLGGGGKTGPRVWHGGLPHELFLLKARKKDYTPKYIFNSKGFCMTVAFDHFQLLGEQALRSIAGRFIEELPEATIDENKLSSSTLDVVRNAALNRVRSGAVTTTYNSYGLGSESILSVKNRLRNADGTSRNYASQLMQILDYVSPEAAAESSLGAANVYIDDRGNLMITDTYDFHSPKKGQDTTSLVAKVHSLFEPGGIFEVSDKNSRKVLLNLGPAPADVATTLRNKNRIILSPTSEVAASMDKEFDFGGGFVEYAGNIARGAYNSITDALYSDGAVNEENVPIESSAVLKSALDAFFQQNPERSNAKGAELNFPSPEARPPIMDGLEILRGSDDSYIVGHKESEDIRIKIPAEYERMGYVIEEPVNTEGSRVTFSTGMVGDGRLDMAVGASKLLAGEPIERKPDELSFTQAFARNKSAGEKKFTWRGEKYTTELLDMEI
jgi:hypothetical protein